MIVSQHRRRRVAERRRRRQRKLRVRRDLQHPREHIVRSFHLIGADGLDADIGAVEESGWRVVDCAVKERISQVVAKRVAEIVPRVGGVNKRVVARELPILKRGGGGGLRRRLGAACS